MSAVRILLAIRLTSVFVLTGCATLPLPSGGTVLMKISTAEAHVRMNGDNLAAVEDHVILLRKACSTSVDGASQCWMDPVGRAEVTQVLSGHDMVVRVPSGVIFTEGDRVEVSSLPGGSRSPGKP